MDFAILVLIVAWAICFLLWKKLHKQEPEADKKPKASSRKTERKKATKAERSKLHINGLKQDSSAPEEPALTPVLEVLYQYTPVPAGWICPACEGENDIGTPCCTVCGRPREDE